MKPENILMIGMLVVIVLQELRYILFVRLSQRHMQDLLNRLMAEKPDQLARLGAYEAAMKKVSSKPPTRDEYYEDSVPEILRVPTALYDQAPTAAEGQSIVRDIAG